MLQNAGVLHILPCKCASPHSGVPFLDIGTTKSGPRVWCFPHFDLQICFAPQPRAIFEHRNFQNGSANVVFCAFWLANIFAPQPRGILEHRNFQNGSANVVFCAFWLANVLRATDACHFSTSDLQKWLRDRQFFCIFTCKCASRHSGVPFFNIGTSKSATTLRCFVHFHVEMCFAPQRRAIFHSSAQQLPPHPPL